MKIAVCYKIVRNSQQIRETSDGRLDFSEAENEIGQYDTNAIEAAVRLAGEVEGSSVVAVTVGDQAIGDIKMRKGVLSRGPAELFMVSGEGYDTADAFVIADSLKKAVEKIGDVDVVICGEGSGDIYAQQTGTMLGAMLGWSTVNAVNSLSFSDGALSVVRELENSSEELRVALPAVISVTSSINTPRIPALKDILQAGKKPVTVTTGEQLGADMTETVKTVCVKAPEKIERCREIYGDISAETVEKVCAQLSKLIG